MRGHVVGYVYEKGYVIGYVYERTRDLGMCMREDM